MQSMYSKYSFESKASFKNLCIVDQSIISGYLQLLSNRQVSPYTYRNTLSNLNAFFLYFQSQSHIRLVEVTKENIRDYLTYLSTKALLPGTINYQLSTLKKFFEYLVDEDYMNRVPVLHRYFLKNETRLPRPIREADIEIFLSNLKDLRYRCIFLLMLRSGLRVGEVCQLKQEDVQIKGQKLMVRNGKGKVDRLVYFSLAVKADLEQWLNQQPLKNSYCFPSKRKPGSPLHCSTIREWMKNYLKELGLSQQGYTPHSLRHTFATNLLNVGVPLVVLKDLMGHRTLDQTLMYAKLSDQTIRRCYENACEQLESSSLIVSQKEVANG